MADALASTSGRKTSATQDYKDGGITNVSADGASAAVNSVERQKRIEAKKAKMKAARFNLEKKVKAKRIADEDANDPTLKQYPDLKRKR